jgi:phosphocarrier protein HPr
MTTPPAVLSPPPRPKPVPGCVTLRRAVPKSCPAPKAGSGACSRTFTYANSLGLHARPAALLVKTVFRFKCAVTAQHHGNRVNVRSILSLLSLAVGPGIQITFKAQGPDAAAALAAIAGLFESRFGAAYGPHSVAQPPAGVAPTV